MDDFAHVHRRIAEYVSNLLSVDLSAEDVYEILNAQTLGWQDGVVAAVQTEADEYGIPRKGRE